MGIRLQTVQMLNQFLHPTNSSSWLEALYSGSWWCTRQGGKYGRSWTAGCCGGLKCRKLLGGGEARCVERRRRPRCVPLHEVCGGPGRRTMPCCHGRCRRFIPDLVDSIMKCI